MLTSDSERKIPIIFPLLYYQVLEKERKRSRNGEQGVASEDEEEDEAPETPRQQRKRSDLSLK